jgi:two-component sensor histidine kinase
MASLEEKEVLLREIHHRVKNNLQVMSSLLNLQSRYAKKEEYRKMFEDTEHRVRSMALIHEQLYQSQNLAKLEIGTYLSSIVRHLAASFSDVGARVDVRTSLESLLLGITTAIPLGFTVTELVSNCFKHAFRDGRPGQISVSLHSLDNNVVELIVRDNGMGMPDTVTAENAQSLGLRLVRIFADQLEATLEMTSLEGTEYRLKFEVEDLRRGSIRENAPSHSHC